MTHPAPDSITFQLPPALSPYKHDIRRFVDAMLYKLQRNAHKGRWENLDTLDALKRMLDEVQELAEAIDNGNTFEVTFEAADVANFAMILCSIMMERGR